MTDRIRIQPLSIDVPPDEPFKNDLLGRKPFAESLAATLGGIEGPGVFAIDGQWGTGKTTFVRMFEQHLRNEGFRVVNINAWDTDYADDPLAALVSSVAKAEPDGSKREKFKKAAVGVLKIASPAVIRAATYGILDLNAPIEKSAADALGKFAESGMARFEEHAKSMDAFKDRLKELAGAGDKPLIVIVDELDRCRPTYAVEMLETIKHAFEVDNLLFVLALNRKQLDQSATVLYGTALDPESYFRRFFDFELRLADGDRKGIVRELLRSHDVPHEGFDADILVESLARSPFGIRSIGRTIRHYALAYASLIEFNWKAWSWMLPCVMLWRLIDRDRYHLFVSGNLSDDEFVDGLFDLDWLKPLRRTDQANLMEATAIAIHLRPSPAGEGSHSPLLERYQASHDDLTDGIPQLYSSMRQDSQRYGWLLPTVVTRVEMLQIAPPT